MKSKKKKERELIDSENYFKELVEMCPDIIFEVDTNLMIRYTNSIAFELFGYSRDEFNQGLNISQMIAPEDMQRANKNIKRIFNGEIVDPLDYLLKKKDGAKFYARIHARPIYKKGKITGMQGIINNMTEYKQMEQNLIDSEKKFKALYKGIPIPSYIWQRIDNDFVLIDYNYAAEKETNNGVKRFLGMGASKMYKDRPAIINDLNHCFEAKTSFSKEMKYHFTTSGESKDLLVQYAYISPDLVLAHTTDITEKKRSEQKLKESEEKFRTITEQMLMGILILQDDLIKYSNEAASEIAEIPLQEILDISINELAQYIHPEDSSFVIEQAKKKQEGKFDVKSQYTFRLITKSKKLKWLELFSKTILYQGKPANFITLIDITEKKQVEKELRESKEKYRLISEEANDMIAVFSQNFEYEYINEIPHLKILGYSKDDLIGRKGWKFIHPEDRNKVANILRTNLDTGENSIELRIKAKDGQYKWIEIRGKKIVNRIGEINGIIIARNINERKKAEEKLKESEEKYHDAYELTKLYKDLIAHDMNNILQNILSSEELCSIYLNDPGKLQDICEYLKIIKDQVKRGGNLISNIRKLSQLEETQLSTQSTEVCAFLKKAMEYIRQSFQERKINIEIKAPEEIFYVKANNLLIDVFENILLNAVKYNENSNVEITIKISKIQKKGINYLKMEFIDNGIGIPDIRKSAIFQKEYKKDQKVRGMGVGLSLVYKIIISYNGEIWVEDKIQGDFSKGSNFIILIPESENMKNV